MDRFFAKKNKDGTITEPVKIDNANDEQKVPLTTSKKDDKKTTSGATATAITCPKTHRYLISDFTHLLEKASFKPTKVELSAVPNCPIPFCLISDAFELISSKSGANSQEDKKEIMTRVFELVLEQSPLEIISVYDFCLRLTNVLWLQKDLGIGTQLLLKSVATVTGRQLSKVRADFQNKGCLGIVLEEAKDTQNTVTSFAQKPKVNGEDPGAQKGTEHITFRWIFESLKSLGEIQGSGSQAEKEAVLVKLFRAATGKEAKYISRFIYGNYKIGFAERMFQTALARAFSRFFARNKYETFDSDSEIEDPDTKQLYDFWEETLQNIFTQFPDHHTTMQHLITTKSLVKTRKLCKLTPGVPCKPMLAKPTKSLKQVFDRFENRKFTCEYKYDGLRGQIHYDRKMSLLRIFSRNLEDMTLQYPDISLSIGEFVGDADVINKVKYLSNQLAEKAELTKTDQKPDSKIDGTGSKSKSADAKDSKEDDDVLEIDPASAAIDSFIIDSEIVAFDRVKEKILPFQVLATRARKNVNADDQVSVCIFIFDVLLFNGKPLIDQPLAARRKVIRDRIDSCMHTLKTGIIKSANYADCNNLEALEVYLEESITAGCEGLMVKTLEENATYEPAKRSFKWLKVKKDYLDRGGLGDTFDLVVVGARYGEGKRKGKLSTYLMACYNQDSGNFECTVYVGGGFTDQQLEEFSDMFKVKAVKEKPRNVLIDKDSYPEVWISPEIVFEIKAADILLSPTYKAGRTELQDPKGCGLALRFARFMRWRKDKTAEGASDSRFMVDVYRSQALVKDADLDEDDDYY